MLKLLKLLKFLKILKGNNKIGEIKKKVSIYNVIKLNSYLINLLLNNFINVNLLIKIFNIYYYNIKIDKKKYIFYIMNWNDSFSIYNYLNLYYTFINNNLSYISFRSDINLKLYQFEYSKKVNNKLIYNLKLNNDNLLKLIFKCWPDDIINKKLTEYYLIEILKLLYSCINCEGLKLSLTIKYLRKVRTRISKLDSKKKKYFYLYESSDVKKKENYYKELDVDLKGIHTEISEYNNWCSSETFIFDNFNIEKEEKKDDLIYFLSNNILTNDTFDNSDYPKDLYKIILEIDVHLFYLIDKETKWKLLIKESLNQYEKLKWLF